MAARIASSSAELRRMLRVAHQGLKTKHYEYTEHLRWVAAEWRQLEQQHTISHNSAWPDDLRWLHACIGLFNARNTTLCKFFVTKFDLPPLDLRPILVSQCRPPRALETGQVTLKKACAGAGVVIMASLVDLKTIEKGMQRKLASCIDMAATCVSEKVNRAFQCCLAIAKQRKDLQAALLDELNPDAVWLREEHETLRQLEQLEDVAWSHDDGVLLTFERLMHEVLHHAHLMGVKVRTRQTVITERFPLDDAYRVEGRSAMPHRTHAGEQRLITDYFSHV